MKTNKKVVLITGVSRGLGKFLAKFLSDLDSYVVYGTSRNPKHISNYCNPLLLDLSKEDTIYAAIDDIIAREGRIDIVINNAGIAYYGPVDSMTSAEMQELFNVNVFGVFKLMQYLLPLLRKQREGKILFVSSIRGVESHVYMGAYSASKAAIESMALDWAVTLAKWNIEVSVVQPGPLDTGIQLKAGSFFSNKDDPYAPYANFPVKCQSAEEAAKDIIEKIINGHLPFRFQTSKEAEGVVKKHLVDLSGNEWLNEQKRSIYE